MNFTFTKEQEGLCERARAFAREEIRPVAAWIEGRDEPGFLGNYPRELLRKMGQEGFLGSMYPREYGGQGMGLVEECIVAEEFAYESPAAELARFVSCGLFGMPLFMFGSKEQIQEFLPPLIAGEIIGAIGITEPHVGSDTARMKTRAILENGEWIIDGEKRYITNGSEADVICLFAITNPEVKAHQGMSTYLFETKTPGFSVIKNYEMMGLHGCRVAHLKFDDCRIPEHRRLGELNKGFKQLMMELNRERVGLAAQALGALRRCLDIAVRYSTERIQFGRPIKEFEAISFKVADIATKLETSRLLVYSAAWKLDNGIESTREASMAKLFASDEAISGIDDCLQILGGAGYTCDEPVEQFYRDARIMAIGGGTREIMKYIISREVYKEAGF